VVCTRRAHAAAWSARARVTSAARRACGAAARKVRLRNPGDGSVGLPLIVSAVFAVPVSDELPRADDCSEEEEARPLALRCGGSDSKSCGSGGGGVGCGGVGGDVSGGNEVGDGAAGGNGDRCVAGRGDPAEPLRCSSLGSNGELAACVVSLRRQHSDANTSASIRRPRKNSILRANEKNPFQCVLVSP